MLNWTIAFRCKHCGKLYEGFPRVENICSRCGILLTLEYEGQNFYKTENCEKVVAKQFLGLFFTGTYKQYEV
jgi:uncharacterized protein (DUF983 family)